MVFKKVIRLFKQATTKIQKNNTSEVTTHLDIPDKPIYRNIRLDTIYQSAKPEHGIMYQPDMQMFLYIKKKAEEIFANAQLSKDVKTYYSKIFSKLDSQETFNLQDTETLKCYLALKKLVKHEGKVSLQPHPGHFDEKSPFLGEYVKFYAQLKQKKSNAFKVFCDALYNAEARFQMIPPQDRTKADVLGEKMLIDELKKYGTTPQETFDEQGGFTCCIVVYDVDNQWNDWNVHLLLNNDEWSQENSDKYCPFGVVALHELGHIRQTTPGISQKTLLDKTENSKFCELAPTIDSIVRQDEIYKNIHNIPMEEEVVYPNKVSIDGKSYNIGAIANYFRQVQKQYGYDNFEQTLLTPEVDTYIKSVCKEDATKHTITPFIDMHTIKPVRK